MDKTSKYLWTYLIDNGGVIEEWSYYGNFFVYNDKLTEQAKKSFKKHGADWDKMQPVSEGIEQGFLGTFTSEESETPTLKGELITNGNKFKFGLAIEDHKSIFNFLAELLPSIK